MFGDFQSLKLNPDEHRIQPIGASHLVVFSDEIHAARYVRKTHTSHVDAFESPLTGPIGWVTEGRVQIVHRPARVGSSLHVLSANSSESWLWTHRAHCILKTCSAGCA
nr:asparaginase domain-containing protein [Xenophilus sp. Marseille-Q4582]